MANMKSSSSKVFKLLKRRLTYWILIKFNWRSFDQKSGHINKTSDQLDLPSPLDQTFLMTWPNILFKCFENVKLHCPGVVYTTLFERKNRHFTFVDCYFRVHIFTFALLSKTSCWFLNYSTDNLSFEKIFTKKLLNFITQPTVLPFTFTLRVFAEEVVPSIIFFFQIMLENSWKIPLKKVLFFNSLGCNIEYVRACMQFLKLILGITPHLSRALH